MSIIPKEAIEVIAQSIGITNLAPDVALALAPDLEYRVREIMQEAIKCMRHCLRTVLTGDDVDTAFHLRNVEPVYGFSSGDPLRFKRAAGHIDLFYTDDKGVEFKEVVEAPILRARPDTSVNAHWLALEGIQPNIPENAPLEVLRQHFQFLLIPSQMTHSDVIDGVIAAVSASSDGKKLEYNELRTDVKQPIKHVLSMELQQYFKKIMELTLNRPVSILFKKALLSLATDPGLQPLVPEFICFIENEVGRNLQSFPHLFAMMRVSRSLLQNPHIHIEPYLHKLLPSVLTCLIGKRLGHRYTDNHWELRNFSATLVSSICKRFGHAYHNLQPRVTRTLLHTFLDPTKALPQHYGAILGLAALGPSVVHLLILPNIETYLLLLEPEMLLEKQRKEVKRHEAWHVYGALVRAAGLCMYDRLKMFTGLLSPPTHSVWKGVGKIAATTRNKRKAASSDNLMQQPPLKKIASDGAIGVVPMNPLQVDVQRAMGGFSASSGNTNVGVMPISRHLQNDRQIGREARCHLMKTSAVLSQAWKEDMDAGNLLASLLELVGEPILAFTPKAEFCVFI